MLLRQLRKVCHGLTQQYTVKVSCRTLCNSCGASNCIRDETLLSKATKGHVSADNKQRSLFLWQKEADEFITNLDDESVQRKRDLEVIIELMRHDGRPVPGAISSFDWKILLTECDGTLEKEHYLKYLYEKQNRERIKLINRQLKAKEKLKEVMELNYLESTELFMLHDVRRAKYFRWWKGIQAMQSDIPVIIDFGVEEDLREQRLAASLMQALWSENINHLQPLNVHFTSIYNNFWFKDERNTDAKVFVTLHEEHFLDLFPLKDLIYLSPDGPPLLEFDPGYTFVIGGSVDMVAKPQLTLNFARKHGIKCASLPIRTYYDQHPLASDSLTFCQVYKILLDMYLHKSWKEAFRNLPSAFTLREGFVTEEEKEIKNEKLEKCLDKKMLRATDRVLDILNQK